MDPDEPVDETTRPELSPQTLTDRLSSLERGDRIVFNNRGRPFEVVATDRYSVTVTDPGGNTYTFSQNLQTGGWEVHESVWWVSTVDETG